MCQFNIKNANSRKIFDTLFVSLLVFVELTHLCWTNAFVWNWRIFLKMTCGTDAFVFNWSVDMTIFFWGGRLKGVVHVLNWRVELRATRLILTFENSWHIIILKYCHLSLHLRREGDVRWLCLWEWGMQLQRLSRWNGLEYKFWSRLRIMNLIYMIYPFSLNILKDKYFLQLFFQIALRWTKGWLLLW